MKAISKRVLAACLSLLCVLSVCVAGIPGIQALAASTAKTTDYLNLRTGPGTSYRVILTMPEGTTVTIVDNSNGDWAQVRTSSGTEGYCSTEYLEFSGSSSNSETTAAKTNAYLNLRKGPGLSYGVLFTMAEGSTVTVLEDNGGDWVKVRTASGTEGYCSREYLTFSSNSGSVSTTTAKTTDYLNLRTGPGTSYRVLYTMEEGSTVTVLEDDGSGWVKVRTASGDEGYCSREYLDLPENEEEEEIESGTAVTTAYLNLRKGPGLSYDVLYTMALGSTVTILGDADADWVKVRTASGDEGYCSREYLKFSDTSEEDNKTTPAKTTDYLNLRKGPGMSYDVIFTMAIGSTVTVMGNTESDWVKVKTASGTQGYCSREYLIFPEDADEDPVSAETTDYLNLRTGPGTSYAVIETMGKGETITVLSGRSEDWARVRTSDGKEGYCSTEYLRFPGDEEEEEEETAVAKTTDYLNLRKGPGMSYDVLFTMAKGSTVTVLGDPDGDWVKVRTASGTEGYCSREYLQFPGEGGGSNGSEEPEESYVRTTTAVNFRTGPGTSYSVIRTLSTGTVLTVLDDSNSDWVYVSDSNGTKGYVSAQYVQAVSGSGSISLSHTKVSIPALSTIYTTGSSASGMSLSWKSSNTKVATVQNGYIYGVAPGPPTITASAGGESVTISVTVTEAAPVKSAYTDPNVVLAGESCNLVAITDSTREAVRFVVDMGSSDKTYNVTKYTSESSGASQGLAANNTRVWQQSVTFSQPGSYRVRVYSQKNGKMSSDYEEITAFVVSTLSDTSSEERRASNEMLDIISEMEGYSAAVYPDSLAYNIPTLGYGYVLAKGEVFYNNLTKREAWALLCNSVNEDSYTSEVNRFIQNNNLLANQSQFDSMVSFSYNIGSGYWNNTSASFDLRTIMLNAVEPPKINGSAAAKTTASLTVYKSASESSGRVTTLSKGVSVSVLATKFIESSNEMWYQIRTSSGSTGWARGAYIAFNNASSLTHNLKYTDAIAFGSEMLAWHKAGGVCLPGLLYRRLAEAKVYSYADYDAAHMSSSNYKKNTYGYHYPSCLAGYEQ